MFIVNHPVYITHTKHICCAAIGDMYYICDVYIYYTYTTRVLLHYIYCDWCCGDDNHTRDRSERFRQVYYIRRLKEVCIRRTIRGHFFSYTSRTWLHTHDTRRRIIIWQSIDDPLSTYPVGRYLVFLLDSCIIIIATRLCRMCVRTTRYTEFKPTILYHICRRYLRFTYYS